MAIKTRNIILDFGVQASDAQAKLDRLSRELKEVETKYRSARAGSLEFIEAEKQLVKIQRELGQSFDDVEKKTTRFQSTMNSAAGTIGKLVAFVGIAATVQDAGQKIIAFDQALADLSALTGATGGDLEFLANKAKEFGRTTTVSAIEATEAFKLIASAKPELLQNSEALAALTKEAIILSEASGLALPQAAEQLGSALNAMSLDASEAGRVINVLAAAAQLGTREIPFVTEAFSKFGGVAAQAGISIEESAAAVEILGKKIPEASIVGTNLRGVLVKLQVAAQEEGRTFEGLGAELDRYAGRVQDITFLKEMFGEENLLAAQTLIAERDALAELEVGITGTNAAYEQAAKRTETMEGALKRLRNAWESVVLRFSSGAGAATTAIRFLADNLDTILRVVGAVVVALVSYRTTIFAINTATRLATIATTAYRIAKVALGRGISSATSLMKVFNTTVKANPIGLLISGITALITLFYDFGDAAEEATEKQEALNEAVREGQRLADAATDINKQAAAIDRLNEEQLKSLRSRIEQEIAATEEKASRIIAVEEDTRRREEEVLAESNKKIEKLQAERAALSAGGATREELAELGREIQKEYDRQNLLLAQAGVERVDRAVLSEEGISIAEVNGQRLRYDNLLKDIDARLKALKKSTKDETEEGKKRAKAGTIAALQQEVNDLRDKITDDFAIGSVDFAKSVELYKIKSKELEEAQASLRDNTEEAAPDPNSIAAFAKRVSELREEVERTNVDTTAFDDLIVKLQKAEEELQALRDRVNPKESKPVDTVALAGADLDEAERNQLALAQIYEEGEIRILDIKIAFARARLQVLKESGQLESDEYERQLNQLAELEAQKGKVISDSAETQKQIDRQKTVELLDNIQQVVDATFAAINTILSARIQEVDNLINLQSEQVSRAREIAEEGNAELLQLEEERLDDLNKKREAFVRKQQALAAIQLVAESALAIAKAAAQGGAAAPFTIAATLIALAAGLAQARILAGQAAFYKGGYTGEGDPRSESLALGRKPYTYHKGEFVMDHVVTKKGRNREFFDWILKGRVDLEKEFSRRNNVVVHAGGSSIKPEKFEELIHAVRSKPVSSLSIDKRGIVRIVTDGESNAKRIRRRTS